MFSFAGKGVFMKYVIISLAISVVGLVAAFLYAWKVKKQPSGNERMREIAHSIHEGAKAFLYAEYRIIIIFVAALSIAIGVLLDNWYEAISFILGAGFSVLAGYCGMNVATIANVRTANAAKEKGMSKALSVAFSGGSVMGLCVAGFGLLGICAVFAVTKNDDILFGFSLGASSIALFARVGGGIYTKAADVGADLVGKVEAGIPEDDPRNPAVIADNVGDNVGDVAGMGADLFESYAGAVISAVTLGMVYCKHNYPDNLMKGAAFPLIIAALGLLASVIGTLFVRGEKNPALALKIGTYVASGVVLVGSMGLSYLFFGDFDFGITIVAGTLIGILIGYFTEVYTSDTHRSVMKIAKQSETGTATNIIQGIAIGFKSTCITILFVCLGIFLAYLFGSRAGEGGGIYGIALAAVGMLSTTGITVAVDAYGPIADNAGGIAEMSDLPEGVREITDKLDSVGNTTAAMGKGFAIGSAALTALALFFSYKEAVGLTAIDLLDSNVVIGLFIGGMLPFLFSALTIESVNKAAYQMIEEVRRQFRTIPGLLEGKAKPDYKTCVEISTNASLREMVLPAVLAIAVPLVVGVSLGINALGGLLAGSLVTGVLLAIFMSNSGGAWDNAKKFIESGNHGGKGSPSHKASVVGDTVGDPFKDTAGPSINILIKLMTVVALVFAPVFLMINGGAGLAG